MSLTLKKIVVGLWDFLCDYVKRRWLGKIPKAIEMKVVKLPIDIYIDSRRGAFFKCFDETDNYNTNIDPILYDRATLLEALKDQDNDIEESWKRRVLYESTPRGNVVMHYDVFKQGFVYYSDQSIPYTILNAVAMKYSVLYRCLNFFTDENELPCDLSDNMAISPFIISQKEEEKRELSKKREHHEKMASEVKKSSFAKFKKYPSNAPNIAKTQDKTEIIKPIDPLLIKNRFIYLGKIVNFSFIQPMKHKRVRRISTAIPTAFDSMFGDISNERISYKTFKQLTSNQLSCDVVPPVSNSFS